MRSLFAVITLILLSNYLFAAERVKIYEADAYVLDQTEGQRTEAFKKALRSVVLKASGSQSVVDSLPLEELENKVDELVLSFTYRENPSYQEQSSLSIEASSQPQPADEPQPTEAEAPFILGVKFSEALIENRLSEIGAALWSSLRPEISIWIVEQRAGERYLIGEDDQDAFTAAQSVRGSHGVPLILPTGDLNDLGSVQLSTLWGLFPSAAQNAAQRYGSDMELLAKLRFDGSVWSAEWLLPIGNENVSGSETSTTRQGAISEVLRNSAEALSSRFAFARAPGETGVRVFTEIQAVDSFSDYVAVMSHLSGMAGVKAVYLEKVTGSLLTLRLDLVAGVSVLEREVALAGRLKQVQDVSAPTLVTSSEPSDSLPMLLPEGGFVAGESRELLRYIWLPETNS